MRSPSSGDRLPPALREAIELGSVRTRAFAAAQREHLVDFEVELVPGLVTGQRYVPVARVGAYLPAGRFPLTASAFMTVGVAKVAGVRTVVACTPPQPDGSANDAVLYAAAPVRRRPRLRARRRAGPGRHGLRPRRRRARRHDRRRRQRLRRRGEAPAVRGGGHRPAGRTVGGRGDRRRDRRPGRRRRRPPRPGRARHRTRPRRWSRPRRSSADAVVARGRPPARHARRPRDIAGPAWRDHGRVLWAADREAAVALMDDLAPEHLEVITVGRRLVPRPTDLLRLGVPRAVVDGRLLRQGHGRHEPHAADRRRRQAQRRSVGRALPQVPHLPACLAGSDA